MKKRFIYTNLLIYCFFAKLICSTDFRDFDCYQETVSRNYVEEKIANYLQHDSELENFYKITDDAISVFASPEDKINKNPEYILRFGSKSNSKCPKKFTTNFNSDKPLSGLKIAIDPGHLGGGMAIIEERFIDMAVTGEKNIRLQFDEGTLALFTAKIIKGYLSQIGANVLVTKEEPGQSVYNLSFTEWCKNEFGINCDSDWLSDANQEKILARFTQAQKNIISNAHENKILRLKQILFRGFYNNLDLKARAEKINAFNPDLTVIIHYNAHGGSNDIATANYNMTFIPGSFLKNELSNKVARYEFVRLLVTNDFEESLKLSECIVKNMQAVLFDVPLMNSFLYSDATIIAQSGIYCRNLALTRLIHGPLCYGETLIQNNLDEAKRLAQKDFDFNGTKLPPRIIEVARAYFQGICEYFGLERKL